MKIETKFDTMQRVKIIELDNQPAKIINIILRPTCLWYTVEYWWEGRRAVAELTEDELCKA